LTAAIRPGQTAVVITPAQAIDAIHERFGSHSGHRALHAKGIVLSGTFTPTAEAARLTKAAHFAGPPVPVLARVSNGGGDPTVPDYAPDVRGLAVSFELPGGKRTVISGQTLPVFPMRDADGFFAMMRALHPRPSQAWRLPAFLAGHPKALVTMPTAAKALRLPRSYATLRYYAIHAFRWIAADGSSRYVRYTWEPVAGDERIGAKQAKAGGRDYLSEEIRQRLEAGPVRFTLRVQIAGDGDNPDDPSAVWPASRQVVDVGTLELTAVAEEPKVLVMDPTAVTDGIELSDDPVLRFRAPAYSVSVEQRIS
jgi:catalase